MCVGPVAIFVMEVQMFHDECEIRIVKFLRVWTSSENLLHIEYYILGNARLFSREDNDHWYTNSHKYVNFSVCIPLHGQFLIRFT